MNENTMSFYVTQERLEETKKKIRSLDSLRFIQNPSPVGKDEKEFYISISGAVEDFNELNKLLNKYHEEDETKKESRKESFFSDFFALKKRKQYEYNPYEGEYDN